MTNETKETPELKKPEQPVEKKKSLWTTRRKQVDIKSQFMVVKC